MEKNQKNSVITLGIVLIISTWLLPGFGNLFSCCWPIRVDFFAFNDFLWELMSDAAERRPNKKAERPFVVPEVIKPNHRAPWFAPCVFFHVCVCVCKDVCVYMSLRERERERETSRYILFERRLQALLWRVRMNAFLLHRHTLASLLHANTHCGRTVHTYRGNWSVRNLSCCCYCVKACVLCV